MSTDKQPEEQQNRRLSHETHLEAPDATPAASSTGWLLDESSEQTPTLTVVLPTLNEEEGIVECIERIREALDELGIYGEIIVSDSSTDRTPELAEQHGAIVVEPDGAGYGYAYRYAFQRARGEYVAMGDADTTYDFTELPKLFYHVSTGEADIALGSRFEGEIRDGAMPALHEYVGNPLLTRFLNTFYNAEISDAHSGMRVFAREAVEQLDLESDGMEFASEMLMEASSRGLTIAEEPITYHPRKGEATLESFSDGWRHLRFMLVNAPSYLFSLPGIVLALVGVLCLTASVSGVALGGATFGIRTAIAGSLLVLTGVQVTSLAGFAVAAGSPVRTRTDPLSRFLTQTVGLGGTATLGMLLFGAGVTYATLIISGWASSGFSQIPSPSPQVDLLGFTAIVLGIQLVFAGFFISAINE